MFRIRTGIPRLLAPLARSTLPGNGANHHSGAHSPVAMLPATPIAAALLFLCLYRYLSNRSTHHLLPAHRHRSLFNLLHMLISLPLIPLPPPSAARISQMGMLLPMLLASSYCANLFTESCNTLIGESLAMCATFMQRLRQF